MVEEQKITVEMSGISSRIFIEAAAEGESSRVVVTIRDAHTNIARITENGKTVFEKEPDSGCQKPDKVRVTENGKTLFEKEPEQDFERKKSEHEKPGNDGDGCLIHRYTLQQLYDYATAVPAGEIGFIRKAFEMNEALLMEGLASGQTVYGPYLLAANGGKLVSPDERKTASLFCNGAIEARVMCLSKPAVSITESGAHGILGKTPEETMRNMGRIASPGMTGTEKTIVEIMQEKKAQEEKARKTLQEEERG